MHAWRKYDGVLGHSWKQVLVQQWEQIGREMVAELCQETVQNVFDYGSWGWCEENEEDAYEFS